MEYLEPCDARHHPCRYSDDPRPLALGKAGENRLDIIGVKVHGIVWRRVGRSQDMQDQDKAGMQSAIGIAAATASVEC